MNRSALQTRFLSHLGGQLPQAMEDFLVHRRWFGGKARQIRAVRVRDIVLLDTGTFDVFLAIVCAEYTSGPGETYSVPLVQAGRDTAVPPEAPALTVRLGDEQEPVVLQDALFNESFLAFLLDAIAHRRSFSGAEGTVHAVPASALASLWQPSGQRLQPSLMKAEQSNSSVIYGRKLVLKLFRKLEEGTNPDLEIGRFLTEKAFFPNTPAVAGHLEYVNSAGRPYTLGILQAFVENRGDAWQFTLEALAEYYERAGRAQAEAPRAPGGSLVSLAESPFPDQPPEEIGAYADSVRLLGRRTAEMHLALSSSPEDPDFSPEPFRTSDQRVL